MLEYFSKTKLKCLHVPHVKAGISEKQDDGVHTNGTWKISLSKGVLWLIYCLGFNLNIFSNDTMFCCSLRRENEIFLHMQHVKLIHQRTVYAGYLHLPKKLA